ncbi:hypothetical protein Bmayo_05045 (plasmid) [Borreliella mayonii]|uniref:Variable large protein n=1 Tax=Borreliella mayonii TaxID=1674146 RepID=A0AAC9PJV2_9SPIR|nr:hypothetical protein Bmayo_05045 [Borreliella mayonii]
MKAIADAANKAAKAASGGDTSIGNVVNANAGAGAGAADASSVQGIAKGMKAIVDAAEATAGKAAGSKEEKKELLKAASATGTGNEDAGHLFSGAANQGANNAQAQKAAGAINAVSGEQILKEIVDAAEKSGDGAGQQAAAATNPISAAIGADQAGGAFAAGNGNMNQNSKVAAAIVLRGMAKDGKFAVADADHANQKDGVKSAVETITETANKAAKAASGGDTSIGNVVNANAGAGAGAADASSVQGIAKGMKAIVDAAEATAGKAAGSKEKKELLKAASATGTGNEDAGHLFSGTNGQGASDEQAQKAAGAINAVSGEQILKEIVDAAEKSGDGAGQQAAAATNPISAAIGAAEGGAAFTAAGGNMNQNSKVAAAIVLRGMAKDGKFAVANDDHANHKDGVKSAVETITETANKAAKAASGGDTSIGNVVSAAAVAGAGVADASSVQGIAKGMKAIVDAAEATAGKAAGKEKKKELLKAASATGTGNADAGHLFSGAANQGANNEQAQKAAGAINAVSGEQILKEIVDAAGKNDDGAAGGQQADQANNPISAAYWGSSG